MHRTANVLGLPQTRLVMFMACLLAIVPLRTLCANGQARGQATGPLSGQAGGRAAGPATGQPTGQPTGPVAAQGSEHDYIVGPSDVLAITVVDQPQLTGKYIVRADGTFTFPMIGRLQAGGLSVQAVEDDVRERLTKGYLKDPQVGVSVDQYRSQQIFVMGEVRQAGTLQFTGSMSLIEALARAGSTTDRAGVEIVVVRQPSGGAPALVDPAAIERAQNSTDSTVIRVNLQTLQAGTLSENVMLRSGDTIFVPRAETVFVSGEVRTPGEYVIRNRMTVRQVLALAGGMTERGSARRIQIVRQVDGRETKISADLEDVVHAGDNIVVRQRLL